MQNQYDVDAYNLILKSEIRSLVIIAVIFLPLLAYLIFHSICEIKNESKEQKGRKKRKKHRIFLYVQLVLVIIVCILLLTSLILQISSYAKDLKEEAYCIYEGPANIQIEKKLIIGELKLRDVDRIISFECDGEIIELLFEDDIGLAGYVDKVRVVYAQNSRYVIEIILI